MSQVIDYYFSLQSPWAYIGHRPFHDVVAAHGATVSYKPVFLGELFSETGGLPLAKRHPARQRYRMVELLRWRDKRGLNFHVAPKHWPLNARLADGVAIAIAEQGGNPAHYLDLAHCGIWENQLDLADEATLAAVADKAGFVGTELVNRSRSDEIGAVYEQNRQDAIAHDVFGAPAYVLNGEVFWGQDRIELLGDALQSARTPFLAEA